MNSPYKRIIIIDDDPIHNALCAKFIIKFLSPATADIQKFSKPKEGVQYVLSVYKQERIKTLLLLDINMPVINGWQVLAAIQKLPPDALACLTIYVLSSSVDTQDISRAAASPLVTSFLEKPLHNHLQNVLGDKATFANNVK